MISPSVQDPEEQRAEQRADHRAGTAGHQRAADDHRGDGLQNSTSFDPDGSGVAIDDPHGLEEPDEVPANPAHITKFRTITRRVLTPASAAARRLPPTDTVYSPEAGEGRQH